MLGRRTTPQLKWLRQLSPPGEAGYAVGAPTGPSGGVLLGTRFYAINVKRNVALSGAANALLCYDAATQAACPGSPYPITYPSGWVVAATNGIFEDAAWIQETAGRIFIYLNGIPQGSIFNQNYIFCWDVATKQMCSGFGTDGRVAVPSDVTVDADQGKAASLFPYVPSAGNPAGICIGGVKQLPYAFDTSSGQIRCWDFAGTLVAGPVNPGNTGLEIMVASGTIFTGTKYLFPYDSGVGCFDMTTNQLCTGVWPLLNLAPSAATYSTYVIREQTPTCYWTNAHSGAIWLFNPFTQTKGCTNDPQGSASYTPVVLANSSCTQSFQGWNHFTLVSTTRGFTSATITFFDDARIAIPGFSNLPLAVGSPVDLSTLPAPVPSTLSWEFSFSGMDCSTSGCSNPCSASYDVGATASAQVCC
ncbi:hypothetical protein DFJ74DRAFT_704149 [Hyaloraphidium curvatum]|nr:hypothetical protein DFJ74DRAFT_704149 [Hyaloraphidium curvatum]